VLEASDHSTPREGDLLDSPQAGPAAVRGAVLRVGGYVAGILLTVGSAALLFRHLGVAETGRYVTVLALIAIVSGITDIGLTTIGMRELAVRDEASKRRFMANLLGLRLVLALVGLAVIVAFAALVGYERRMVTGTLVAGLSVVALSVQSTLGIALMVQLRLGWLTIIELIRQAVLVAAIVALVATDAGLLAFLAIQGPVALVALVLTAWLVRGSVPLRPAFRAGEWRALVREVLPFSAAAIVAALYFRAALIVLGLVSTPAETGYFGAAFRITEVLLMVPGLMVSAAFPIFARAARDDRERLAYGIDRVFQAALLVGGAMMVALILGAPVAIDVVAGPGFEPSAGVLRIQAVALLASFIATTLFYALLSLRAHGAILATACTALVVNVGLAAVLGSADGATGAALATLIAEVSGIGVALTVLHRRHRALVPGAGTVPRIALAVGLAASVLLIPGLPALADAALGTLIYAGVVLALRAVPPELLDAFLRRGERSAAAPPS
jgi:O-antigen/teichoic acid export membrane protein